MKARIERRRGELRSFWKWVAVRAVVEIVADGGDGIIVGVGGAILWVMSYLGLIYPVIAQLGIWEA